MNILNEKRGNIEDSNNQTESDTKSGINRAIFGTSETEAPIIGVSLPRVISYLIKFQILLSKVFTLYPKNQ